MEHIKPGTGSREHIEEEFLLSAIAQHLPNKEIFDKFLTGTGTLEVQLLINGQETSFTSVVKDWWSRCRKRLNEDALEVAKTMVTEAGLEPLADALRNAEFTITEALEKVNVDHKFF